MWRIDARTVAPVRIGAQPPGAATIRCVARQADARASGAILRRSLPKASRLDEAGLVPARESRQLRFQFVRSAIGRTAGNRQDRGRIRVEAHRIAVEPEKFGCTPVNLFRIARLQRQPHPEPTPFRDVARASFASEARG